MEMKLRNGVEIPEIGLGVYKMAAGAEMEQAVGCAYRCGYRLFDTAQMYENEDALGEAIEKNGIARDSIFLVSKVDNGNQGYEKTLASFEESLKKLRTDYLDAFLIHWPGQDQERTISTWKAMEELYRAGKVRAIGVCNFEKSQLKRLLEHCEVPPMIDQIEHTPLQHNEELLSFCRAQEISVMAWAPLLRGNFADERIEKLAEKYRRTPAQILLRWNIQQGILPIPKTKSPERLKENISVFDFELEEADMEALNHMNTGFRTSFDPLTFDF